MHDISRRSLLAGGVAVTAAGLLAACSSPGNASGTAGSSAGTAKVMNATFGNNGDGNSAQIYVVGQDQGIWAKHGLEITPKIFTSGPLQIQALGAGDLDFGVIGPGAIWLPIEGKAKVVAVQGTGNADRIIAQPQYKTIKDLKGKTIGVPEGTSGDMLFQLLLAKEGLSKSDFNVVNMNPPTVISAFSAQKVDAAAVWYPFVQQIQQSVPKLVQLAKDDDFPQNRFPTCIVGGPEIEQKAELLKRFQAATKDIMDWTAKNPGQLPKLTSEYLKDKIAEEQSEFTYVSNLSSGQAVSKWSDGTIPGWFKSLNKQFAAMGTLASSAIVDPSTYVLASQFKAA
ncbi:ABC transporter substrate-binding protein [Humibacter antri]